MFTKLSPHYTSVWWPDVNGDCWRTSWYYTLTLTRVFTSLASLCSFFCVFEGFRGPVNHGFQFPCSGVFTQDSERWATAFRLNPWAKGCADRDYYLFVMVDVISCRYRMEGLWFIALSTATSRTCTLACRMNTALSVLSIRHHHLSAAPPPLTLPPISCHNT